MDLTPANSKKQFTERLSDRESELMRVLTVQFKFEEWHAKDAARRLMRDRHILDDFLKYSRTRRLPVLSVNTSGGASEYRVLDHTVTELMRDYDLSPAGAFLILSELSSSPEEGKVILQEVERYGYTKVERNSKGEVVRVSLFKPRPATPAQQISLDQSRDGFRFCHECGRRISVESVYCIHCGNKQ